MVPPSSPEPQESTNETDAEPDLIGAHRAVIRLAKRTGLRVARADIDSLLDLGLLTPSGEFCGHPLYDFDSLDAINPSGLRQLVAERENWLRTSMDERTAARTVGLSPRKLRELAKAHNIEPGHFGRYAHHDVETLTDLQRGNPIEIRARSDVRKAIRQWADDMLATGVAVLLDVETATRDSGICEIAVIAAWSGETLIDSLVDPGMPISDGARRVHGIRDSEISGALPLRKILPKLLEVTDGRKIIAYNSEYDRKALTTDCRRLCLDAHDLGDHCNWSCLMSRRMEWVGASKAIPLGATHRAKPDCLAARALLLQFSTAAYR